MMINEAYMYSVTTPGDCAVPENIHTDFPYNWEGIEIPGEWEVL